MSDEVKTEENNALQEVQRKVVISAEDCAGASDFWQHFEVPMPVELRAAFDAFIKNEVGRLAKVVKASGAKAD